MDEGEWLLKYHNNIYLRQVRCKFYDLSGGQVKSLTTKQNPEVEIDPYVFSKIE